ncbi:MAG: GNAT family N-acetyltransferase [Saprospiraceae bacterium]
MENLILRTDSTNEGFVQLVRLLDAELALFNGEEDAFYVQFNKIAPLKNVVILSVDSVPVACGAFKPYNLEAVEIKRMYVKSDQRRKGYASIVLQELEHWAKESGFSSAILETGNFLPGTVALYSKSGYHVIPNFDQYIGVEGSICMKKVL